MVRSDHWDDIRERILERDENECQKCGEKDTGLHVHHIVSKSKFDATCEANMNENLVTLCINCHGFLERFPPEDQIQLLKDEGWDPVQQAEQIGDEVAPGDYKTTALEIDTLTWNRLADHKKNGESLDDVINRLLDTIEE